MASLFRLLFAALLCISSFGQFTNVTVGNAANDGTGDNLRFAFQKLNYADNWLKTNLTTVSNLANGGSANAKMNTNEGTSFGQTLVSPITNLSLTASRVMILDSAKRQTNSTVTDTELGYVSGVTSAIQTQIGALISDTAVATSWNGVTTVAPSKNTVWDRFYQQVSVKDYGVVGDGSDETSAIQAAINVSTNRVLYFPPGVYGISGTLQIHQNTHILGAGWGGYYSLSTGTTNPGVALVNQAGASVIFLRDGANVPMITNSATAEALSTSTSANDGRGTITPHVYNASIRNIVLHGNARSQTVWDADILKFTDAWGITIDGVKFQTPAAYAARLWNCNDVHIRNFNMIGESVRTKGFLFYDSADCTMHQGQAGGNIGPTLWLATSTTWQNTFSDMDLGDAGASDSMAGVSSVSTNALTLSVDPKLQTGDPFTFWVDPHTGGSLSGDVTAGKTYFAIRWSSTLFSFATTLPNALAGTPDAISSVGTSMIMAPGGPHSAVYLSEARQNTLNNVRADGCRRVNVAINNGGYNSYLNGKSTKAGYNGGDPIDGLGFWLFGGSGCVSNIIANNILADTLCAARFDSAGNFWGQNPARNVATNMVANVTTYSPVFQTSLGTVLLGATTIAPPASASTALSVQSTNNALVMDLTRIGTVSSGVKFRLTDEVDGIGLDAFQIANTSSEPILHLNGNTTTRTLRMGGSSLATNVVTTIDGGTRFGTDIPGYGLIVRSPVATGAADPGQVILGVGIRKASGATYQTGVTNILVIGETAVTATQPIVGTTAAFTGDITSNSESVVVPTEIDTSAELAAILGDEQGSAGGFVRATSPTITTPTISGAITFPDNTRQTFNPGADAAGLNVGSHAGDPGTPSNGDLWYDSTANELTARINGANVALGSGGGLTAADIDTSAELDTIVTDDTGSGALVFGTGPTLTDAIAATSFQIPNGAAPTTDAFGEIAGDNDAWAASRGAVQFFDGTANTWLIGVLSADTPSNGQVPKWKTGGFIEWEADNSGGSISGTDMQVLTFIGTDTPAGDAGFLYDDVTDSATLVGSLTVADEAFADGGWNGDLTVPTKNSIRDWAILFDADADGLVDKLDSSVEIAGTTDTTITRSAAGILAIEAVDVPTISSTHTLTGKTYDASGSGNVLKFTDYKDFVYPGKVDGTGCTITTNDYTSSLWGLAAYNGTSDTNANYAYFRIGTVPLDLDTGVEMTLRNLAIRVSATDTDAAQFSIAIWSPASSSAAAPTDFTSFSTFINFDSGTLSSPAAGDIFYCSDVTLTGFAAAVTAGRPFIIGIARRNGSNDDTVAIVGGTVEYSRTK